LQCGVTIVRLDDPDIGPDAELEVMCADGVVRTGTVCELPLFDKAGDIPSGRATDTPDFPGVIV
jgi:hypothetical protein